MSITEYTPADLHKVGLLEQVVAGNDRIGALLELAGAGPRRTKRLTWGSTGQPFDGVNEGETFRGVLIINDGLTDAYVALSGDRINAAGAILTVPAGTWVTLPIETRKVMLGGATSTTVGTALLYVLEDAPNFAVGDVAGSEQAIYNATAPTLADGQRAGLQLDQRGNLRAVLSVSNSAGFIAASAASSDAEGGSNIALFAKALGYRWNGLTWDRDRTPGVFKRINAVAVTSGTPVTIWTPTSGKKFRLMGWMVSLSVAGLVIFEDAGVQTGLETAKMAAGVGQASPQLGNGYLSTAANNALQVDVNANGNVDGFVFGTEE